MSKTLATALLEVQQADIAIKKDATNPAFRSKYATLGSVMAEVLPLLNRHGLVLLQFPTNLDGHPALRTKVLHVETGEFEEDTMPLVLGKNDPQGQGSGLTYGRRYAALSILGFVADEDDDGNASSRRSDGAGSMASPASPQVQAPEPPAPSGTFTPPADAQKILAARGSLPSGSAEDYTLDFGANSGKKLADLLEGSAKEKGYVEWLASDAFDAKNPKGRLAKGHAQTLLGMSLSVTVPASPGASSADDDIPFDRTIA